ncbi:hypothetical protein EDF48_1221, partial [Curtobacterium sp. PhB191]
APCDQRRGRRTEDHLFWVATSAGWADGLSCMAESNDPLTGEIDVQLVTNAYIYGFPLVFNLLQVLRFTTDGIGAVPAAAFNTFSHGRTLAGPDDTFVTINNDTLYSMAQVDLSSGPVALHVPDTAGRYYVLQFVDAWTNNFAYVGHRATGTAAGDYLLVPPDWDGEPDDDDTVIRFPTAVASIVGRWAVDGDTDLPTVHALQDATTLTPRTPDAAPHGLAVPDPEVSDALAFLERFRVWSQQFPPAPRDAAVQRSFAGLGVNSPASPYVGLPDDAVAALTSALEGASARLRQILESGSSPQVNGWKMTLHVFDYNLDFFEVGALDDERFRIEDPTLRYAERAGAALGGLWGNHAYEAAYVMTFVDDHGDQLDGTHEYTFRLAPPPPVGAFWSLTMYGVPDFFLVANPINRYSIGDRTPDVAQDADGALTITIAHQPPDSPDANWLPSPAGRFRPVLRMYEPGDEVLDGRWTPPAIVRTER